MADIHAVMGGSATGGEWSTPSWWVYGLETTCKSGMEGYFFGWPWSGALDGSGVQCYLAEDRAWWEIRDGWWGWLGVIGWLAFGGWILQCSVVGCMSVSSVWAHGGDALTCCRQLDETLVQDYTCRLACMARRTHLCTKWTRMVTWKVCVAVRTRLQSSLFIF